MGGGIVWAKGRLDLNRDNRGGGLRGRRRSGLGDFTENRVSWHQQARLHLEANSPFIPSQAWPALLTQALRGPQPALGSHSDPYSPDSLFLFSMTLVYLFFFFLFFLFY